MKRFVIAAAGVAAVGLPGLAQAQDFAFSPRVGVGVLDYSLELQSEVDFELDDGLAALEGFEIETVLPFVSLGGTISRGNFAFDVEVQYAFAGEDDGIDQTSVDVGTDGGGVFALQETDADIERLEGTISFSYSGLADNLSLFTGAKLIGTYWDADGNVQGIANNVNFTADVDSENSLEQAGIFVGAQYGIPVAQWGGRFTLSSALALLAGEADQDGELSNFSVATVGQGDVDFATNVDGDALGVNLGLAWIGTFGSRYAYSLSVDYQNYDFDVEDGSDFSEVLLRTQARLIATF